MDKGWTDGQQVITIAHPEPSAQVELKNKKKTKQTKRKKTKQEGQDGPVSLT